MKAHVLAAAILAVPSLSFAQAAGTGAGAAAAANAAALAQMQAQQAQLAAFSAQMAAWNAARQRELFLLRTNRANFTKQLNMQARLLSTEVSNGNTLAALRSRGVEDGPTLIAALHTPPAPQHEAMLLAAAAQASAGQQTKQAGKPAEETAPAPGTMPPMMIRPTFGNPFVVDKPKFSTKAGKVDPGTAIKLHTDTHYATIYYTTNGWTPTSLSAKYSGPIKITSNTKLQVIAMGPNYLRSEVERAEYTVDGSTPPALETAVTVPADGTLRAGTPIRVVFGGAELSSEKASIGDEITILTDEDITLNGKVVLAKGTRVNAALTTADQQHGSIPGDLVWEARSIDANGTRVPLYGSETLEGEKHEEAIIKPGMTAVVFVSADTPLK